MEKFDAVVLGGGPGGYVSALWLAKAGVKTCLIESDSLGGTCLNRGCIPTKALYHYAKMVHQIKKHQSLGINTGDMELDLVQIMNNKQNHVDTLVKGVETLIDKKGITFMQGVGRFIDDHQISVESGEGTTNIYGDYIIIATGSEPVIPGIEGLKEGLEAGFVITSKEALELSDIPETFGVIGGGVIGMEFGTIFNQFGSEVTVLEAADQILPGFNLDMVKRYKPLAKKQGLSLLTKCKVTKINPETKTLTYLTKKGQATYRCDTLLCSVGRKPRFNNIEIHKLSQVIDNKRQLVVDDFMRSNIEHIFAVGDVNGISLLAHSASKQGVIAATRIIAELKSKGLNLQYVPETKGFSNYHIPQVAFLLPEISQVQSGDYDSDKKYENGKFLYRSNGMALAGEEEDGLCKVEYDDESERLIYMGILGESAGELIHTGVHHLDKGHEFEELIDSVTGHPSLSEIIHEALLDIKNLGIHQL